MCIRDRSNDRREGQYEYPGADGDQTRRYSDYICGVVFEAGIGSGAGEEPMSVAHGDPFS